MAHEAEAYRDLDLAVGAAVKRDLQAAGVGSYPALCDGCHGAGKHFTGQACEHCGGRGEYELAV